MHPAFYPDSRIRSTNLMGMELHKKVGNFLAEAKGFTLSQELFILICICQFLYSGKGETPGKQCLFAGGFLVHFTGINPDFSKFYIVPTTKTTVYRLRAT